MIVISEEDYQKFQDALDLYCEYRSIPNETIEFYLGSKWGQSPLEKMTLNLKDHIPTYFSPTRAI